MQHIPKLLGVPICLWIFIAIPWASLGQNAITHSTSVQSGTLNYAVGEIYVILDIPQQEELDLDTAVDASLVVFPNPIRGEVSIKTLTEEVIATIRISDLNGRIIKTATLENSQLYVDELSAGVYVFSFPGTTHPPIKIIKL